MNIFENMNQEIDAMRFDDPISEPMPQVFAYSLHSSQDIAIVVRDILADFKTKETNQSTTSASPLSLSSKN